MAEGLVSLIAKHRATIVSKWFDSAIRAYAADTAAFINRQKDPFANPVGSNTRKSVEALFDQLVGGMEADAIAAGMDPVMRIRAVQPMSASHATAFVFSLKNILRDLFDQQLQEAGRMREFQEIEARIDRLVLAAFDSYMACRDKINDLKANETRNRTFKAFERAGLIKKDPGPPPDA